MTTLQSLYHHLRTRDHLPADLALYRARLWLSNINYFSSGGEAGWTIKRLL